MLISLAILHVQKPADCPSVSLYFSAYMLLREHFKYWLVLSNRLNPDKLSRFTWSNWITWNSNYRHLKLIIRVKLGTVQLIDLFRSGDPQSSRREFAGSDAQQQHSQHRPTAGQFGDGQPDVLNDDRQQPCFLATMSRAAARECTCHYLPPPSSGARYGTDGVVIYAEPEAIIREVLIPMRSAAHKLVLTFGTNAAFDDVPTAQNASSVQAEHGTGCWQTLRFYVALLINSCYLALRQQQND